MNSVQPGDVDAPFFSRLKSMGDSFFMDVVLHHAVRGDMRAVRSALRAIDPADRQGLLWAPPAVGKMAVLNSGMQSVQAAMDVKEVSLLHAVAIALSAKQATDTTLPTRAEVDAINAVVLEPDQIDPTWLMRRGWTVDCQDLLDTAIGLCLTQGEIVPKSFPEERLPIDRLFQALASRVPFDEAIRSVMDRAPADNLWGHWESQHVPRMLLEQGRVALVRDLLSSVPPERAPFDPHLSLSISLQSMSAPLDSGLFSGLLMKSVEERTEHSESADALNPVAHLLPSERAVIDVLERLAHRAPQHAAAVGVRVLAAVFEVSEEARLPVSTALVRALVARVDGIANTSSGEPWPFDEGTRRVHGITDDRIAGNLLQLALKHHAPEVVGKLEPLLARDSSLFRVKAAWHEIPPVRAVDIAAFRDTLRAVRDAGFDLAAVFDDPNKTRAPGGARPTSSVLHDLAGGRHPQAVGMMLAAMDLGANPHTKDHREWKAKSRLPAEQRSQWEGIVRSFEARSAALAALDDLLEPASGNDRETPLTKPSSKAKP